MSNIILDSEQERLMQKLNKNYKPDSKRKALAEEFTKLCEETQALHRDNPLTEEEIAEEIADYRRSNDSFYRF